MRVLHLGYGFTPWRRGGVIRYAEDVMALQASRGHEVHYVCAGRHYPRLAGPRLKHRRRDGISIHEVVNPAIPTGIERGTRDPALDVSEPRMERLLTRLLGELAPDVLHVQELLGWPSAVLDVAREAGVPVVMTLQDYFPLCPTVRLLRADGERCVDGEVVAGCAIACAVAPPNAAQVVDHTLRYELSRAREAVPGLRRVSFAGMRPVVDPVLRRLVHPPAAPVQERLPSVTALRERRAAGVARLSRVDRLIAQSHRVEELYRRLGVDNPGLRTVNLTLGHLEHLTPRPPRRPGPLTFATIDGLADPSKGSRMLVGALQQVRAAGAPFRLLALGVVEPAAAAALAGWSEVELRGVFAPKDLDRLLDEADVGLLCSQWEEAYGFVGLEFLAKGIPLLANARGGIVDYARDGETGWVNASATADELARRMLDLIARPGEVDALARGVTAAREEIVKPLARHGDELEAIYAEAVAEVAARRSGARDHRPAPGSHNGSSPLAARLAPRERMNSRSESRLR